MNKTLRILVLMIGAVALIGSLCYAANQTAASTAMLDGTNIHTISVSSGGTLSYQDPGAVGPQNYTLTGSPVQLELTDNTVADTAGTGILTCKLSSAAPSEMGSIYNIRIYVAGWTPAADNEVAVGITSHFLGYFNLTTSDTQLLYLNMEYAGKILHGTASTGVSLAIESGKRLPGGFNEAHTITYTFSENNGK